MKTVNVVLTDREASDLQKVRGELTWRKFFKKIIEEHFKETIKEILISDSSVLPIAEEKPPKRKEKGNRGND
jgi:hypothetical protein